MKLFPRFEPDDEGVSHLFVKYRMEGGGHIGDGAFVVSPGDNVAGLTYEEWALAAREGRVVEQQSVGRNAVGGSAIPAPEVVGGGSP